MFTSEIGIVMLVGDEEIEGKKNERRTRKRRKEEMAMILFYFLRFLCQF